MANSITLFVLVAFGAVMAFAMIDRAQGYTDIFAKPHAGGDHSHGHHHSGPPKPEMLRFKALFFVHSTFCYGLPMPNISSSNDGEVGHGQSHIMLQNKLEAAGEAFRGWFGGDASDSDSGKATAIKNVKASATKDVKASAIKSESPEASNIKNATEAKDIKSDDSSNSTNSSASDSKSNKGSSSDSSDNSDSSEEKNGVAHPKINSTVRDEEARLSRLVMRAAAIVVFSDAADSSDALCQALTKAEQDWINYRKANNMPAPHGAHGSHGAHHSHVHHGPQGHHGQHGHHGSHGLPMNSVVNQPNPMNSPQSLVVSVAVQPANMMDAREQHGSKYIIGAPHQKHGRFGQENHKSKSMHKSSHKH